MKRTNVEQPPGNSNSNSLTILRTSSVLSWGCPEDTLIRCEMPRRLRRRASRAWELWPMKSQSRPAHQWRPHKNIQAAMMRNGSTNRRYRRGLALVLGVVPHGVGAVGSLSSSRSCSIHRVRADWNCRRDPGRGQAAAVAGGRCDRTLDFFLLNHVVSAPGQVAVPGRLAVEHPQELGPPEGVLDAAEPDSAGGQQPLDLRLIGGQALGKGSLGWALDFALLLQADSHVLQSVGLSNQRSLHILSKWERVVPEGGGGGSGSKG